MHSGRAAPLTLQCQPCGCILVSICFPIWMQAAQSPAGRCQVPALVLTGQRSAILAVLNITPPGPLAELPLRPTPDTGPSVRVGCLSESFPGQGRARGVGTSPASGSEHPRRGHGAPQVRGHLVCSHSLGVYCMFICSLHVRLPWPTLHATSPCSALRPRDGKPGALMAAQWVHSIAVQSSPGSMSLGRIWDGKNGHGHSPAWTPISI